MSKSKKWTWDDFFDLNGDNCNSEEAFHINDSYIEEIENKLIKAVKVLEMVEDHTKMPHKHSDYYERLCCLAERAAEALKDLKNE